LPSLEVASATQGAAIDWWLRLLVDPALNLRLAVDGIVYGRAKFGRHPCFDIGIELLEKLGGLDDNHTLRPTDLARITDRNDQWQARVCYALALLVEPLRAYTIDGSGLTRLDQHCGVPELLGLANSAEVADLIAMRDLAQQHLLPALPPGPVATGPTFDGSVDLNGDADVIVGGMLIDFKAGQGGKPRKDGTRTASLGRGELDQLIGYALMDYTDAFTLDTLAIYAVRFGYLAAWPIEELLARLAGRPVNLAALRNEFKRILQVDLQHYWQTMGGD
jgi:hypothetical protein